MMVPDETVRMEIMRCDQECRAGVWRGLIEADSSSEAFPLMAKRLWWRCQEYIPHRRSLCDKSRSSFGR